VTTSGGLDCVCREAIRLVEVGSTIRMIDDLFLALVVQ
jgi:hypothetical protein